jgi:diguanylate cyclase (GGDEF)-like protein
MAAAESVRRADQALYAAKAAGRARLLVYSDSLRAERATAAQLAALRRENAALARESRTDALTGAGNRRGFDEDLAAMDARVAQRGAPFAVMFLDLDEFGLVNKIWNHQAGNHTLTETAAAIRGAIRSGDALYRYGGEEFVVLLPDATRDGALAVCERVREGLARRALANPGEDHREHRDRLQQRRRG